MYAAKSAGRFQLRVYHRELQQGLRAIGLPCAGICTRHSPATRLELHFQPQVATADGSLVGAEGFVALATPVRGLLAPAAFLDVILDSPMEGALTECGDRPQPAGISENGSRRAFPCHGFPSTCRHGQLVAPGLPDTVVRVTRARWRAAHHA
ncbi:hypothetical protein ACU4GD_18385 [Cupriavidus basilensis]